MRSLFNHDPDRGESDEKLGQLISNVVYVAIAIGVIVWFFGLHIP